MNNTYLEYFCEILDNSMYEKSIALRCMEQFQECIPKFKSEILTNKINLKNNTKDYYDLIINEILSRDYDKNIGIHSISNILNKFGITIDEILSRKQLDNYIFQYLEADENTFTRKSEAKDLALIIQNDFKLYFRKHFANEIISFCNAKLKEKKVEPVIKPTITLPYKKVYLDAFYKAISNDEAIYETSFIMLYNNSITYYTPYLKEEILENILILDKDKKESYLEFVKTQIKNTPFIDAKINIEQWIKENDASISDYPFFNKGKLYKKLKTFIHSHHINHMEMDELEMIQQAFFAYASNIEAEKMIAFIDEQKEKANNNQILNEVEKIKWNGKPSQLGFIMGVLAELDFIEAPKRPSNDINFTQFARQIKNVFDLETTESTLSKYLNLESDKGQETKRKFEKENFHIPHKNIIS